MALCSVSDRAQIEYIAKALLNIFSVRYSVSSDYIPNMNS